MTQNPSLAKAKSDGMEYENNFELFCRTLGVGSVQHKDYIRGGTSQLIDDPCILIKHCPSVSIYGGDLCHTEFVLKLADRRLRIELKTQNKKGSTDEKIPYFFENAEHQFEEDEIILGMFGEGFRHEMPMWIESRINKIDKNVKVFYQLEDLENYIEHEIIKTQEQK